MPGRLVTFAGSAVAVEAEGERATAVVDFLYRHLPGNGPFPPHRTFRLLAEGPAGPFRLYRDDQPVHTDDSAATIAELLLSQTGYHLADRSQGGLLFHAAGLAREDRGLILPGTMHSGKTTLTAWLLAAGLAYLSDELVFVPTGSTAFQAFARPLNLKPLARPIWRGLAPAAGDREELILSGRNGDLVRPELFTSAPVREQAGLRLIIFPRFQPDGTLKLEPLSRGQAALALMECLVNARNLSDHGLAEAARLAGLAPAYRLSYGSFEQLGDSIDRLWP